MATSSNWQPAVTVWCKWQTSSLQLCPLHVACILFSGSMAAISMSPQLLLCFVCHATVLPCYNVVQYWPPGIAATSSLCTARCILNHGKHSPVKSMFSAHLLHSSSSETGCQVFVPATAHLTAQTKWHCRMIASLHCSAQAPNHDWWMLNSTVL